MSDLLDMLADGPDNSEETAPEPQAPESVVKTDVGAKTSETNPEEKPKDDPKPSGEASSDKPKRERKRLPGGIFDESAAETSAKGKTKGKNQKPVSVSHEKRLRFAQGVGVIFNAGFNVVAAQVGSPVRFTEKAARKLGREPEKVWTVQFPDEPKSSGTAIERKANVNEALDELKSAFGSLFVETTPGESIAYHLAGVVPNVAEFDRWLKDHPFATFAVVGVATAAQVVVRIVTTAPEEPITVEPKG